jgi:hypothetical protein
MVSRVYRTTSPVFLAVQRAVQRLGLTALGTPTLAALIGLFVCGLLLLDARSTRTRVMRLLPARCHDSRNRLPRTMPWSTRALLRLLLSKVSKVVSTFSSSSSARSAKNFCTLT